MVQMLRKQLKKHTIKKMPSEFAKVNITEHKLVSANIKVIGEVNDELKK